MRPFIKILRPPVTFVNKTPNSGGGGGEYSMCQIYATMSIGAATEPRTVCGGDLRQRVLHSDTGRDNVRIAIRTDLASRFYFLLHVEGERLQFRQRSLDKLR